ncbi:MAG: Nicotinamide mononucleotide (NMN) deamidase PncC [Chloroflexi bacterium]|nr:MAG: Nicotinamide mononucleotide (NMN) deamidase PncC [Chloroflexota bacterium]
MAVLQPMGESIGALLKERGETVSVSESSAGGLISASLLSVPGASTYFLGGAVVYTGASRLGLLRITPDDVKDMTPGTEPYSGIMATKIREIHGTTWSLSETGAAGPTGSRYGHAAGHACIVVKGPVERTIIVETGSNDREANMFAFAQKALDLLESCIREAE